MRILEQGIIWHVLSSYHHLSKGTWSDLLEPSPPQSESVSRDRKLVLLRSCREEAFGKTHKMWSLNLDGGNPLCTKADRYEITSAISVEFSVPEKNGGFQNRLSHSVNRYILSWGSKIVLKNRNVLEKDKSLIPQYCLVNIATHILMLLKFSLYRQNTQIPCRSFSIPHYLCQLKKRESVKQQLWQRQSSWSPPLKVKRTTSIVITLHHCPFCVTMTTNSACRKKERSFSA